jgi:xanthine/CO dehydrogenase XdhC/CoxF family maturation factor
MTHEFKDIVKAHLSAKKDGLKSVLATVVALDGSSYRKPGVRMLILQDNTMIGAVSGGCVEKDILRQSQSVFKDGKAKMMTYDGRYRLGCEGILYILLEEFKPEDQFFNVFETTIERRENFDIVSYFTKEVGISTGLGSVLELNGEQYAVSQSNVDEKLSKFEQTMPPCFKLMIFGAEHDAVKLCQLANYNGWEVTVVTGPLESKTINDFSGATNFFSASPSDIELHNIDKETAVVLMSHNFANDLKFLIELKDTRPAYIGMLGPSHRREKLLSQFLEYCPEVDEAFLELIYGPAGLNIGAETPQEIAISVISEILSVVRKQVPMSLKEKAGRIHS